MLSQKDMGPNKCGSKTMQLSTKFKTTNIWVPKTYGSKKIVGPEDMGPGGMGQNVRPRKLSKKKYGSSKIWVKKNVGPKNVVP